MNKENAIIPLTIYVPQSRVDYIKQLLSPYAKEGMNEDEFWEDAKPLPDAIRPGKLLRAARLRADLTQKELAAQICVPQSHISQYEKNKRKIPADKARELAGILQTQAEYFL